MTYLFLAVVIALFAWAFVDLSCRVDRLEAELRISKINAHLLSDRLRQIEGGME